MQPSHSFRSGTQGVEHPHPGVRYQGTTRTCYLPDTAEGAWCSRYLSICVIVYVGVWGCNARPPPSPQHPFEKKKTGRELLALLQHAWQQRLTFTVGRSITTGADNVVVWNGIHHKTSPTVRLCLWALFWAMSSMYSHAFHRPTVRVCLRSQLRV